MKRPMPLLLISALAFAADPLIIKDKSGWSSQLPTGFVEIDQPSVYRRLFTHGTDVIGFQQLKYPSALDRDGDCEAEKIKASGMTVIREAWEGLSLCGFRTESLRAGKPVVTLTVQVPMIPNAINVSVLGAKDDEKAARVLLRQVLNATKGPH